MFTSENADKFLHACVGMLIYAFTGEMLFVIAAGFGKEIYDYKKKGIWDGWDLIATIVGGLLAFGITGGHPMFIESIFCK